MYAPIYGHIWAHTWAIWEQHWGIHGRIHRPYGSSNGACMRAYIGHIWGHTWGMHARIYSHIWEQPYRESREEGNNRESLPFPGLRKGITPGLSFPFPAPSSKEGKRREGNPYSIP